MAFRNAARTPACSRCRMAMIVVPPGRRHHLTELDGVLAGVPEHLRRADHRLDDQLGGDVSGQPEQDAGLDHRLGQQEEVGRARSRWSPSPRPGASRAAGSPARPTTSSSSATARCLSSACVPGLITDIASSTSTGTFDITRTTGVPSGDEPLDERRPDARGERDHQVLGCVSDPWICSSRASMSWGLTVSTRVAAHATASGLESVW